MGGFLAWSDFFFFSAVSLNLKLAYRDKRKYVSIFVIRKLKG